MVCSRRSRCCLPRFRCNCPCPRTTDRTAAPPGTPSADCLAARPRSPAQRSCYQSVGPPETAAAMSRPQPGGPPGRGARDYNPQFQTLPGPGSVDLKAGPGCLRCATIFSAKVPELNVWNTDPWWAHQAAPAGQPGPSALSKSSKVSRKAVEQQSKLNRNAVKIAPNERPAVLLAPRPQLRPASSAIETVELTEDHLHVSARYRR